MVQAKAILGIFIHEKFLGILVTIDMSVKVICIAIYGLLICIYKYYLPRHYAMHVQLPSDKNLAFYL
jgi:hypothetical protein